MKVHMDRNNQKQQALYMTAELQLQKLKSLHLIGQYSFSHASATNGNCCFCCINFYERMSHKTALIGPNVFLVIVL